VGETGRDRRSAQARRRRPGDEIAATEFAAGQSLDKIRNAVISHLFTSRWTVVIGPSANSRYSSPSVRSVAPSPRKMHWARRNK
jgi:hypothetical protein